MRTRQAARGHGVVWAAAFSQSPFRHLRLAASLGREPQPAVLDTPHAGVAPLPARLRPTAGSDPHLVYQQAKIQSRSPALCQ